MVAEALRLAIPVFTISLRMREITQTFAKCPRAQQ